MSGAGAILWPLAFMAACAIAGQVAALWIRLRAEALLKEQERAERERGILPKFEALSAEVASMRTEQKTFLANARSR